MFERQDRIQQARAEIASYGTRELELTAQCEAKTVQLVAAEMRAGEAYLEGQENNIGAVVQLKAEIDVIGRAIDACRSRRKTVLETMLRVEAQGLKDEATAKQRDLEELGRKTEKHLAALTQLELEGGVVYTETILGRQPAGDFDYHVPRSVKLRAEIEDLWSRAAELEQRGVPTHGSLDVEATSTTELFIAAAQQEGIIPPLKAITEWAEACQAAAADFGKRVRRFRLVWGKDGSIDFKQSSIFVPDFGRKVTEHPASTEKPAWTEAWCDVNKATFRAA